ncbi:MAG: hypothetical protein HYX92_16625 [Chloroflexi bacterium]|nr:hypothetical protein [Chloroflexota bacterium]
MLNVKEGALLAFLVAVSLLLASCAPAASPTPVPRPATAPSGPGAPAASVIAAPALPSPSPKGPVVEPRYGGVLTRALSRDPDGLDLQRESGSSSSTVLFNIYQGLVRLHPLDHEKVAPELAEKWEVSADGRTYTFRFRNDIKWHDGKPLTMEDVKYSLDRMHKPKEFNTISPRGQPLLAAMDSAEIAGPDSIRVITKYASASFLTNLATGWVAIEPKHILVEKGDMRRDTVGTGAFRLKQFNPGSILELEKNVNYHTKGLPYLDGIQFYTLRDGATRFAAFRTGKVKMTFWGAGSLRPAEAELVKREMADRVEVYEHLSLSHQNITFNTTRWPWSDARVRKAVDLAFDRQALLRLQGRGQVGFVFAQPWGMKPEDVAKLPGYRQPKDEDVAQAKRLLAEAGVPNGFKTTIQSPISAAIEAQAVFTKDQLAKIGIDAQVNMLENPVRLDRVRRRAFDLDCFGWTDNSTDPDDVLYTKFYGTSEHNESGFSDKKVDELIDKQARTLDFNSRRAILAELETEMIAKTPVAILYWDISQTGAWKEVRNFNPGSGIHIWGKLDMVWLAR